MGADLETRPRSAEKIAYMSNKTLCITEELYEYMLSVSLREPDVLRELRDETRQDENANMQRKLSKLRFRFIFMFSLLFARLRFQADDF